MNTGFWVNWLGSLVPNLWDLQTSTHSHTRTTLIDYSSTTLIKLLLSSCERFFSGIFKEQTLYISAHIFHFCHSWATLFLVKRNTKHFEKSLRKCMRLVKTELFNGRQIYQILTHKSALNFLLSIFFLVDCHNRSHPFKYITNARVFVCVCVIFQQPFLLFTSVFIQ